MHSLLVFFISHIQYWSSFRLNSHQLLSNYGEDKFSVRKDTMQKSNPIVFLDHRIINLFDVIVFFIKAFFVYVGIAWRCFFPRKKRSVAGEVALITGAGNGIGRDLALQMGRLGAIAVCVDIKEAANNETVKMVQDEGNVAFGYQCDVSDNAQVASMCAKVVKEVGDVTIVFNNAGVRFVRPLEQYTQAQIEKMISVNLMGQMWVLRSFLPSMVKNDRGSIVSVCALAGWVGFPNMLPFDASKFAIRGVMEGLHIELRQKNPEHQVHLMTVAPFVVDTGMIQGSIIRFPGLVNLVSSKRAAQIIIANMRRREAVVFIPWIYFYIMNFMRILPLRIQLLMTDFIDMGVEIHYDNFDSTERPPLKK